MKHAGKVFVSLGVSLDGYMAGPNRGPQNPMGGAAPTIHDWVFDQQAFRKHLSLGDGGETGLDNRIVEATFNRIGANIMGRRMFDEGEVAWPEKAPFGCPVFVLTNTKREPWERKGTTFYFVNDCAGREGLERVLSMAREAAGAKDVRISGGRDVVLQYLNAGLVDELQLAIVPRFLGEGLRLFEGIDKSKVSLEIAETIPSARVTHVRYAVKNP